MITNITGNKNQKNGNIILIGMPAAGKSTSGILLAKKMGYGFIDTDILIQTKTGKLLGRIIEESGIEVFLEVEEEAALAINSGSLVIATGGSMVYSEKAMNHLKKESTVFYLKQQVDRLMQRMGDPGARGVVCPRGKSIGQLHEERHPLYMKYADFVIECGEKSPDEVAVEILMKTESVCLRQVAF
jgi:shikimate kinase